MKKPVLAATLLVALSAPLLAAEVVGEWSFDDGAGDVAKEAKGKHDAKITGAQWTDGVKGKALEFHGPDYSGPYKAPGTFVEVPGSEGLLPKKSLEVSATVYPTMNPTGWGIIVSKGEGYLASYELLMLRNGKARGVLGTAEHFMVDSPEPLKLNAWTRLRLVWDGKVLRLFVEGKQVAQQDAVPKSLASDRPIQFGRLFTGKIDDVKIVY